MALDVSVIVPTYNRADLIRHTLQSILTQYHRPAEIIVVDDGSTDETEAIVGELGSAVKYTRIQNSGECRARNVGVKLSSAPWVAFCDSDDLWRPDKLLLQARLFDAVPELEYSFTNFKTVVEDQWSASTKFESSPPGYWNVRRREPDSSSFVIEEAMCGRLLKHQPIFPSTVMMKRSFFDAVGGWNEPLGRTRSVDLEFHFRCVARGPLGVIAEPVVGIRKHASNFSADSYGTTKGEIEILRYLVEHSALGKLHERAIYDEIALRSASAAAEAFAAGDFVNANNLIAAVPISRRSWKIHLKNLIAQSPRPLPQLLRHVLTFGLQTGPAAASK